MLSNGGNNTLTDTSLQIDDKTVAVDNKTSEEKQQEKFLKQDLKSKKLEMQRTKNLIESSANQTYNSIHVSVSELAIGSTTVWECQVNDLPLEAAITIQYDAP